MNLNLIPTPSKLTVIDPSVTIKREDLVLTDRIRQYVKKAGEVITGTGSINIDYEICDSLGKEEYRLAVTGNGVRITASAPNGVYYALVTLSQLFQLNNGEI